MNNNNLPFLSIHSFFKEKFDCRVYKVAIDGGFSCPNRDGKSSLKGCIFCDEKGSSSRTNPNKTSIKNQIINNIKVRKTRYHAKKFIAYFQSFTNTYAEVNILKKKYDEAINADKDIVGLSISTRSDSIDEEKIKLIASYKEILPFVCVELGLQSIHDKTLKLLNRRESYDDFLKALELLKKYDLHHCIHIILGLPHETLNDEIQTAKTLAKLNIDGIKIHMLVAMKDTILAKMYDNKLWTPYSEEKFIKHACHIIEHLHPSCIIHRVSATGHPLHIHAPKWMGEKNIKITSKVIEKLKKTNSFQGKLFN